MSKGAIQPITREELAISRSDKLYAGLVLVEHERPKSRLGMVGKKFGRLTVVDDSGTNKHGQTLAYCRCDCGKLKSITATKLKSKSTVSCGCYRLQVIKRFVAKWAAIRRKHPELCYGHKDLLGRRFGRLLVVARAKGSSGGAVWRCKCDCGRTLAVVSRSLLHGRANSCGCYLRERAAETCRLMWATKWAHKRAAK